MSNLNVAPRTIFCRDNIDVLRGINSDCIDLIYLDPPFNKKKVFTAPVGSSAEGASFSDIFGKDDIKDEWVSGISFENPALHAFLTHTKADGISYNYCYLVYMAIRLIECRRILNDTGSIYLHCDPTMSHYLKVVMDSIFGEKNFRNEIVWCYTGPSGARKNFPAKSDTILRYTKSDAWIFNAEEVRVPYKKLAYQHREESETGIGGKLTKRNRESYLKRGKVPENWWDDISPVGRISSERTNYPTQKPVALLERIIKASTNEGDVVLDPFCGCATTCVAAEKLRRQWIGVDVSQKAYELVKARLGREIPPDLFNPQEPSFTTTPPARNISVADMERGYVYVISNAAFEGVYKVGIAKDVSKRLNSYQTSDPKRGYKLEHAVFCTNYIELEKITHDHFKGNRENEWVTADKDTIINFIKEAAENPAE